MKHLILILLALLVSSKAWSGYLDCSKVNNDLDNAKRELNKAYNYFNINVINCFNLGPSCLRPQPKQCTNQIGRCRVGQQSWYSCSAQVNADYRRCLDVANQAADNKKRQCENYKISLKSECKSEIKKKANSLISRAKSRVANSREQVSYYCN